MVGNEIGLKVKLLKSENGGEYKNEKLKEFCASNGIKLEKTISKTPQQNGEAEHMNITLNKCARSMRIHTCLPRMFWATAVNTTTYLINCGPPAPFGEKLLEEV